MSRHNWLSLLALLLLTTFDTASLRGADHTHRRPFKGHAEGAITSTIPPNGIVIEATGNATNLGKFTRTETLFLNPDGSFTGTIVFVAANGHQLHCIVTGAFVSPNDAVGTYEFTGGTGRFACATGHADFVANTPDGVNVSVRFIGHLSN